MIEIQPLLRMGSCVSGSSPPSPGRNHVTELDSLFAVGRPAGRPSAELHCFRLPSELAPLRSSPPHPLMDSSFYFNERPFIVCFCFPARQCENHRRTIICNWYLTHCRFGRRHFSSFGFYRFFQTVCCINNMLYL